MIDPRLRKLLPDLWTSDRRYIVTYRGPYQIYDSQLVGYLLPSYHVPGVGAAANKLPQYLAGDFTIDWDAVTQLQVGFRKEPGSPHYTFYSGVSWVNLAHVRKITTATIDRKLKARRVVYEWSPVPLDDDGYLDMSAMLTSLLGTPVAQP